MAKKGKKYRGQRVQKSYMYGCGCFICTGHDKEGRMDITEKLIDKEALTDVNDFILHDVISCDHGAEFEVDFYGTNKIVCGYCGKDKIDYL